MSELKGCFIGSKGISIIVCQGNVEVGRFGYTRLKLANFQLKSLSISSKNKQRMVLDSFQYVMLWTHQLVPKSIAVRYSALHRT